MFSYIFVAKSIFILSIYIYLIVIVQSSKQNLAPTHLFVLRVGPCLTSSTFKVNISEMSIKRDLYDFSVSGDINVTEDLPNGWQIIGTMEKCVDIRNLDTCDYFRTFPIVNFGCAGIDSDEVDVYTLFFYYTLPRISCPIKAGSYKIQNYPFFTGDNHLTVAETKISTSLFGYTLKLEGFMGKEKILCTDVILQLLYIRDYNWDVKVTNNTGEIENSVSPGEIENGENPDVKERESNNIVNTITEIEGSGYGNKQEDLHDEGSGSETEPATYMVEEDGDIWKKLVVY